MTDTFPPANLGADSAPWGRKVEESVIVVQSVAEAVQLGLLTATQIQNIQGEQISVNNADRVRDISAVNTDLGRKYTELVGVNNSQNGRMTAIEGRASEINGDLQGYKFNNNTRLNGVDFSLNQLSSRISTVESRTTLVQASSIDGLEFLARGGSGQWYRVPQSVGSPMGGNLKWPLSLSLITDEYGPRPDPGAGGSTNHRGMDFGGGGPIKAAGRGVVVEAGPNGGLGNWVLIRHKPGLETGYAHMAPGSPIVSVGQAVAQGQTLGTMGTTGTSTGIHLHFEVHVNGVQVNPRTIISGTETV